MSAEQAMAEIWSSLAPDCGPEDYAAMVREIQAMQSYLRTVAPTAPGALPIWLAELDPSQMRDQP